MRSRQGQNNPGSVGNYNLTLRNAVAPNFTAATPTMGFAGTPYSYQFQATGSEPSYLFRQQPAESGQLNPVTGILSGTPTFGQWTITVAASNGATPDATANYVLLTIATDTPTTFNVAAGTMFTVPTDAYLGGTIFNVAGATVTINGGTFIGMSFNLAAGASVDFNGSSTVSGMVTGTGAGTVQFSGGIIATGLGGLTLNFPGNMFQWSGGIFNCTLGDVTNLGILNLVGPNQKQISHDGTLANFGTIIQTGTGNLDLHSDSVTPTTLIIEPKASYLLESDSGIDNVVGGASALINTGTIIKTASTGTSEFDINGALDNTGVIEADSGTLDLNPNSTNQISRNTLTGGTWNALNGATLELPSNTNIVNNQANLTLSGAGATIVGLSVSQNASGGSFVVTDGADVATTTGFTNSGSLTLGPGSTFTVNGFYAQTGTGTLNEQMGGTPLSGSFGQLAVLDTSALGGDFNLALVQGYSPSAGDDFQVISFASATGNFLSYNGLYPFFTTSLGATGLNLDDATVPAVDLGGHLRDRADDGKRGTVDHRELAGNRPEQSGGQRFLAGQCLSLHDANDFLQFRVARHDAGEQRSCRRCLLHRHADCSFAPDHSRFLLCSRAGGQSLPTARSQPERTIPLPRRPDNSTLVCRP